MSKENKKIKNIFDQQRAKLPDGFWGKLEPNIPEYKQKKNRFLGLPLWGCLSVFFIISLAAIISYSVFKINETTNMVDRAFESATKNSKLKSKHSKVLFSKMDTTEVSGVGNEKGTENTIEHNIVNQLKPAVEISNKAFHKPKIQLRNKVDKQTLKGSPTSAIGAKASTISPTAPNRIDEEDKIQHKLKDASIDDREVVNGNKLAFNKQGKVEEAAAETIDPITALSLFVKTNNDLVAMEYTHVEKEEKQEIEFKRSTFLEAGYNTVFAQRTITSDTRNSWRSNKTKYEKDFISHEGYVNYGKYLNKNVYLIGGLRYTVIQELFDLSYDTISVENFSFMKGKRTIKHTNKFHTVDVSLGIGAEHTLHKFTFGGNLGLSYNLLFEERGIGLNGNDELQRIEDSSLYTNNAGLSLTNNFYIAYVLKPNVEFKLNAGARNYLKDLSSAREGLPIGFRYKALHLGISVRYLF